MKKEREDSEKKKNRELVEIRTKELRVSEEKYRELFEEAPDAYFSIGTDKSIKRSNKAAERLLNYSKEEFLTMTVPDLYADTKNGLEKAMGVFQRFLSGEEIYDEELQMKTKNGNLIWISLSVKPVLDANGKVIESRSIVRDITERKQVEQKLKESEERYRNLIERTPAIIQSVRADGSFNFVNQTWLDTFGYTREEIQSLNMFDIIHPESQQHCQSVFSQVMQGESVFNIEATFVTKEGQPIYVEGNAKAYFADGKVISTQGIFHNITERKKTERKLKESEEKYRLITENANDIIAVLDDKFRLEYINETPLNNVLGYNSVDYIGKSDFLMIHQDDRKMVLNGLIKGSEVGEGRSEARLRHKDGHYVWVESKGNTFFDRNGEKKILLNIRNITARKKAEKERNNVLEEIKRSNAELEEFAFVASHDLQEPLRMVSGFANLLEKRYRESLDKDAHDFIDFIIDGAKRMHNLINDLLTFSRIGTRGKVFKPTDMNVVLEAALNNIRILAIETNAIITNDPLPVIIADDSQMVQLFQNLISNAIKFHGPVHPKIHISGETKKKEWFFTITDNGIGIDSKDFERIFVIFQRLHKKGEYSGTGIGLAVCKKIIQRHGGKIWVESELKKGSIFHFSIPRN